MNLLDTIIANKRLEITRAMAVKPVATLQRSVFFERSTISLKASLLDQSKTGIIAEYKRRSPSKGTINDWSGVTEVTSAYASLGASGISVLTDHEFFGGNTADLSLARSNDVSILRKDFIIDEYQVLEAKAIGADVILLIAACLSPQRVKELAFFARQLQLEVLLEIHTEDELAHICDATELVGINNRDLKTFTVDIKRALILGEMVPEGKIKIAESGITDIADIATFKAAGFRGFLMGEKFMKATDPGEAFKNFVQQLKQQ